LRQGSQVVDRFRMPLSSHSLRCNNEKKFWQQFESHSLQNMCITDTATKRRQASGQDCLIAMDKLAPY
jgi:hypothetical protein